MVGSATPGCAYHNSAVPTIGAYYGTAGGVMIGRVVTRRIGE
jgi:hypothetical protein